MEVKVKDKSLFYCYKNIEVEVDCSDHHSKRHLDAIAADLNKFFQYDKFTKHKEYLDIVINVQKTKMPYSLLAFIESIDDVIRDFVAEYGFKQTEEAKTELFVTQDEIDQLLILSMRVKLMLPYLVYLDSTDILKELAKDVTIGSKLFRLISNRLMPFKHNDKAAWNFLKMSMFDNIDVYAMVLLAFIQKKVLLLCNVDRNPIVFILSIASDCIRWMSHTTSMYTEAIDEGPVFTIQQTKLLALVSKMKQQLIEWFGGDYLNEIEKNKIIGPLQRVWCFVMKPYLYTSKFGPQNAAVISAFTAQALLKHSEELQVCNYMLKASLWIPHVKTQSGHIDERKLLSKRFVLYGIDMKPFVRDELVILKNNNYIYHDPVTKSKKIVSFRSLENDMLNFFELYCRGIVKSEVEKCVLPYLKHE